MAGGVELRFEEKRGREDILQDPLLVTRASDWENTIVQADNLVALRAMLADGSLAGKVRLVYIDPPFATGATFIDRSRQAHYDDTKVGGEYLRFLHERLVLIRELLADDGSLYLHLDDKMVHYAKVLLDEIFGPSRFRNMLSRQKCHSKNATSKQYGEVADYILFYSKSDSWVWNRQWEPWTEERIASAEFQYKEPNGRRYKLVPLHAPGIRNGETGKPWRGLMPPAGKHWQHTPTKLDQFDARGEIHWSKTGNPRRKVYLDSRPGAPVTDIWLGMKDPMNQHTSATGYPTEKNLEMLKRIISASSNPGDVVLDCFMGSGSTLAAASELGRKWIGVDDNPRAVELAAERVSSLIGSRPVVHRL